MLTDHRIDPAAVAGELREIEAVANAILSKVPEGYGMREAEARDYARAAISAHKAALADAGLVIVPREPTEAMLRAGSIHRLPLRGEIGLPSSDAAEAWRAMIEAHGRAAAQSTEAPDAD